MVVSMYSVGLSISGCYDLLKMQRIQTIRVGGMAEAEDRQQSVPWGFGGRHTGSVRIGALAPGLRLWRDRLSWRFEALDEA
jgi:hypothetical protein